MNKTKNNWNKIVAIACILHCSTSYSMEIDPSVAKRFQVLALDAALDRVEIKEAKAKYKKKTDKVNERLAELEEKTQVNNKELRDLANRIAKLKEQKTQYLGTNTREKLAGKLLVQLQEQMQAMKTDQKELAAKVAKLSKKNLQCSKKLERKVDDIEKATKAEGAKCTEELNASACKSLEAAFDFIRIKCEIMQQNIEEYDAALENADRKKHAEITAERQKLVQERKGIISRERQEKQKIKHNPNVYLDIHGIINRILGNGENVQNLLPLFAELQASSAERETKLLDDVSEDTERTLQGIKNPKAQIL